jgi:hypothetical protein
MTDTTVRFPNLNDSNYAEWSVRMEAILVRQGLWSMVKIPISGVDADGEVKAVSTIAAELESVMKMRDAGKMDEARAEMILRVDDGQLSHMRSRDPLEIWETLERVHRAAGFATSLALRRRFLTAKKGDGQSMQAWIGHIQGLVFHMEQSGVDVSDQDKILALTMGLPPSYDPVIINFDTTPSELLTLNNVIARLLNEEVRQASNSNITKDPEERDEAMTVTGGGKGGRGARNNAGADVTCFFCGEKGHFKSDCPEKRAWEKLRVL